MAVDDHGLEVLKKSGEQVTPGNRSDYLIKTKDTSAIALLTSINAQLSVISALTPFVSGSYGTPNVITAGGGISIGDVYNEFQYVRSNAGNVTVISAPQIQASTKDGAQLVLYGTSDTNYLILNDGNGLLLNGPIQLKDGSIITLIFNLDLNVFVEVSRNGI